MRKKKIAGLIMNRQAQGYPLAAAVTLGLLMLLLVVTQYARMLIIASGVKDALQEAVISTVNDNYADVYHAVREGYAAGYQPSGGDFLESYRYGDVYKRLDGLLGLAEDGGFHAHYSDSGEMEYRISALNVEISNGGLASGETDSFEAAATVLLEVPVSFLQKELPDMSITIRTKAAYTPKF